MTSTFKPKNGFTLAETLITLAIIGVIAALSIPNLISKYQEQVTINKVKKFHSTLTHATKQAVNEYGPLDTWDLQVRNENSVKELYKKLFEHNIKIAKDCGTNNKDNCVVDAYYKKLSGNNHTPKYANDTSYYYYRFLLADGSLVLMRVANDKYYTTYIFYDANGKKGPNQFGKDFFMFGIKTDIVLSGSTGSWFDKDCLGYQDGTSCASWVIYKGNMDYLRCPEKLSWDGKSSCK